MPATDRNTIITQNLPLVRTIARQLHRSRLHSAALEDLESAGHLGLIKAVDNFEPERGIKLETYASALIRGAMLDSTRDHCNSSKNERRRARKIDEATAALEQSLGRIPTRAEIANHLHTTEAKIDEILLARARNHSGSLDECFLDSRPRLQPISTELSPLDTAERREVTLAVTSAVETLAPNQRRIIALTFHENLSPTEVAEQLRVSPSWIFKLKRDALDKLRWYLEHNGSARAPGGRTRPPSRRL